MKVLMIGIEDQACNDINFCLQVKYPDIILLTSEGGSTGLDILETELPDLVFVGTRLNDISLVGLISKIRELSHVPLIVMSERQSELRQAEILENGADDLVTTQFSPIEFLAKIGALLRRTLGYNSSQQKTRNVSTTLSINFGTREVFSLGKPVHLTRTEFNLLSELVRNEGNVISHRTLLENIWGPEYNSDTSFLKKYVYRLRCKLESDATNPQLILNERGIGYRFNKVISTPKQY